VTKNDNFGQILTFGGILDGLPFIDEGQIWCARADMRSTLTRQISSQSILSPSGGEKPQSLPFY